MKFIAILAVLMGALLVPSVASAAKLDGSQAARVASSLVTNDATAKSVMERTSWTDANGNPLTVQAADGQVTRGCKRVARRTVTCFGGFVAALSDGSLVGQSFVATVRLREFKGGYVVTATL